MDTTSSGSRRDSSDDEEVGAEKEELSGLELEAGEGETGKEVQGEEDEFGSEQPPMELEKQEEAKLTARYPQATKPMAGHSAFLQKRLAKGQKYFDSGDYQMAKQMGKNVFMGKPRMMPPVLPTAPEIPTAEAISHNRKASLAQPQSKLASSDNS